MAFGEVDQVFIDQFESEVHTSYQVMGSQFRNFVRRSTKMPGQDIYFPKIAAGTATRGKTRKGLVPTMNLGHDRVKVSLLETYAADYIDYFDQLKTNVDERRALVESTSYALARDTDTYVIAALDGATTNVDQTVNLSLITASTLTNLVTALGALNVPVNPSRVTCAVSWQVWGKMLTIQEFVNSQWVGPEDLPLKTPGIQAKSWGGAIWFPSSELSIAANVRSCYAWDRMAIGHGVGEDVKTEVAWIPERKAWFVDSTIMQGAVLIDGVGVQRLKVTENA